MSRQARVKSKTGIYHIILRGINRQNIFEEDVDKKKFIDILKKCKEKSGFEIYGYCLMDNHIHMLIKETNEEIAVVMKRIGVSYVTWFNNKYQRSGHLFQDRYKSEVVEEDRYILTVLRYIHQNPIKAGMVKKVNEYKWSSYKEYISGNGIVQREFILGIFSNIEKRAIKIYSEFMKEANKDECLEVKDKLKISDDEARKIILEYFEVQKVSDIQNLDKTIRNRIIGEIKQIKELPTRQIARIIGISQSVIAKA